MITDLEKANYPLVGSCIYCGATEDLEREHIVPHGLYPGGAQGAAVLRKASCREHAKITSQFEQEVLRSMFGLVRVQTGMKSRSKHAKAPSSVSVTLTGKDGEQHVDLARDGAPVLVTFPIFAPPGFLSPGSYAGGLTVTGAATYSFGRDPQEVARDQAADGIRVTQSPFKPAALARMVGKIAYCHAWAEGALDRIEGKEAAVLPAIRGERDDIGRWVGTFQGPLSKFERMLHRVVLHEDTDRKLLFGQVQLFAYAGTPRYGVILGRLK